MKFISTAYEHKKNLHTVLLEGDEKDLPHPVLISMAEGCSKEQAMAILKSNRKQQHTSGEVVIKKGNKTDKSYAKITVFTD